MNFTNMGVPSSQGANGADHLPSILFVGMEGVGKRSLVSTFFQYDDREAIVESADPSPLLWTIDNKYYSADVTIHINGIIKQDSLLSGPRSIPKSHTALVMVFDVNQAATFEALQQWAARLDLAEHDILLCIGNKVDKVSSHSAHTIYRRRRLARGDAGIESAPDIGELDDFGVQRSEGSAFLRQDEDSEGIGLEEARLTDLPQEEQNWKVTEWCADNCVEYIESCAVDPEFDKAISVDGEEQGVARIKSALAAHLWPGYRRKDQGQSSAPAEVRPACSSLQGEAEGDESEEDSESEPEDLGYKLLGVDNGHDNWESFDPQATGEDAPTVGEEAPATFHGANEAMDSGKVAGGVISETDGWATNWQSAAGGQRSAQYQSGEDTSSGFADEPVFRAIARSADDVAARNRVAGGSWDGFSGRAEDPIAFGVPFTDGGPHVLQEVGTSGTKETVEIPVGNVGDHGDHTLARDSASSEPDLHTDSSKDSVSLDVLGEDDIVKAVRSSDVGSEIQDKEYDRDRIVSGGLAYEEELRKVETEPPGALAFEALERMMGEMAAMRSNLHGMPDQARKEMAASLAFRLAEMFDDGDGED